MDKSVPPPREQFGLKGWELKDVNISHAAMLHHLGKSNKEISTILDTSEATVSRLVQAAKRAGYLQTYVNLPYNQELAGKVLRLFRPEVRHPHAIVVAEPPPGVPDRHRLKWVSTAASRYVENVLENGLSVTIDGGRTVATMIESLRPRLVENLKLFPTAGPLPYTTEISADALIARWVGKYGQSSGIVPHFFPAPFNFLGEKVDNAENANRLIRKAEDASLFILGIGNLDADSTLAEVLRGMDVRLTDLIAEGIIGSCCYNAFDKSGKTREWPLDRLTRISADCLKRAARSRRKKVIVMGRGKSKRDALRGLLRGGWCNCLVTDTATAELLVESL